MTLADLGEYYELRAQQCSYMAAAKRQYNEFGWDGHSGFGGLTASCWLMHWALTMFEADELGSKLGIANFGWDDGGQKLLRQARGTP